MEYNYIELGNFINSAKTGGDAIKKTPIVDYETDIRCLRIGDISNKRPYSKWGYSLVEEKYKNQYLLKKNDILIARTGNTIGVGTIIKNDINSVFNNGLIRLIINEKGNPYYIYYLITSTNFKNFIYSISGGTSTQPNIKIKHLLKYMVPDLPLSKQKQFANYLLNIDKKIDLNQHIIANLEELSQTLFKRWFVDFEFPDENGNPYKSSGGEMIDSELGNIPRDWEVNELGNYVDIIKGLSYKGAFLDKQHERSDSFPLLSISNFNFISGFKSNKTKYYFGDYKERHLVNPGDILIAATDLTQDRKILGAPAIIPNLNKTMIFSLDVFKITETTIPKYVLYFLLQSAKYREFVEGSATGTTVIRIAKNVILKVPIVIDKDISLKFDNLIKPYMEKIEHLSQENQKLTQLRDTLLPKLMSGEIEIPDDIEVNQDELSI
ncbi:MULTISPECIES: restriction endonuclease subunit S [Staphylococcus]|uniref:restriction endonuclease subunit S n=1 Tax=Staphylococcus TaxID=1279 RepID=UPI001AEC0EE7|nr:restriction endonuclease subunit S [Staphylococcus sp. GDY8P193P]MDW4260713.1 restriction endonuclease subunit S [Staphylococcus saprophyticus]